MQPYKILFAKMGSPYVFDPLWSSDIVCKDFPFKMFSSVKDIPKQSWYDEDGDIEFIPAILPIAAYSLTAEFIYKGPAFSANLNIKNFFDYLTGHHIMSPGSALKVYDTYTRIGRQNVRVEKIHDDLIFRHTQQGDLFLFKIDFKVNDPVTDIILELDY